MRHILLVLLGLLIIGSPLQAAGLTSKSQVRQFSTELVGLFLKEDFEAGFNRAKQNWPLPPVEIDGLVRKVKKQWPTVRQRFGEPLGMEFLREESIGDSFVRLFYLHKFRNHALYWRFDYYRPETTWKINSILFLDSLDELYR